MQSKERSESSRGYNTMNAWYMGWIPRGLSLEKNTRSAARGSVLDSREYYNSIYTKLFPPVAVEFKDNNDGRKRDSMRTEFMIRNT